MRRARVTTLGVALLTVVLCASSALSPAPSARAAGQPTGPASSAATTSPTDGGSPSADEAPAADPTLVRVPFAGEAEVSIAEPWTVVGCDGVVVPAGVRVSCEPSALTFVAESYDPDYGTATLPLELVDPSGLTRTVTYRVEQSPPTVPGAAELTYANPFVSGSGVRVPWSDLELRCDGCDEGPRVEVTNVSPEGSAVARASATHLVVQGAPGFVGESTVTYTLTDDQGQTSDPTTVAIVFTAAAPGAAADEHLVALDVVQQVDGSGATTVDLASLVFTDADDGPVLVGCGAAVLGTVSCAGDVATYRPAPLADTAPADDGAPRTEVVDQFSFHVATASGQQATGSVTLVRQAEAVGPVRLRPAVATDTVVPALPSEEATADADSSAGLFAPFTTLLDRLGGTP